MTKKAQPGSSHIHKILKHYQLLSEHARDIILFVDCDTGMILEANQAATSKYGYNRKELLNLRIHDLRELDPESVSSQIEEALNKGILFETVHICKNGDPIEVEVSARGMKLGNRNILLSVIRDISDRKKAQRALVESEERFRTIFEQSPIGMGIVDCKEGHFISANPALCEMFGYAEDELKKLTVPQITHPDDNKLSEAYRNKLNRNDLCSYNIEKRYLCKNGGVVWGSLTSTLVKDKDGNSLYNLGMIENITGRKRQEEALRQSEERFRNLVESTNDWVWEIDEEDRYRYASPKVLEILGFKPEEVIGKTPYEFMPPEEADRVKKIFHKEYVDKSKPIHSLENICLHKHGRTVVLETSGTPIYDAEGNYLGYRGIDRDITERKQMYEIIRHQAYYDSLTDLPNRALFYDRLSTQIEYVKRYQKSLAVLFFDLDYFKDVNDSFGHVVGDKLLQRVADRLKKILRQSETCARLGGDEFLVLLPKITQAEDAVAVAKRINRSLRQPWMIDNKKVQISASIGIALYPNDGKKSEDLIHCADTAMYYAKNNGKGCYVYFDNKVPICSASVKLIKKKAAK